MRATNLPIDVLRTFLAIIELESFTKTGEQFGRTQSAISLQVRRLEELVGQPLLKTSGRHIEVTAAGDALARYARQILRLNDEVVSRLQHRETEGVLRVGLPIDYAVAFFQLVLTNYLTEHPSVQLEISCALSDKLLDALQSGDLDVVIAMYGDQPRSGLAYSWAERPIWVRGSESTAHTLNPVPIAAHNSGCEYRNRMTRALDLIGRPWRIVFSSPGITGVQNAVRAGLGVSAMTRRTLTAGMQVLGDVDGFPPMADIRVGLHYKHSQLSDAGLMLVSYITQCLHDSGQTDLLRLDSPLGRS